MLLLSHFDTFLHSTDLVQMQCFPLYTLLLAMGRPTINLLVLDIEGFELAVLRTLPWDQLDVEVIILQDKLSLKIIDYRTINTDEARCH